MYFYCDTCINANMAAVCAKCTSYTEILAARTRGNDLSMKRNTIYIVVHAEHKSNTKKQKKTSSTVENTTVTVIPVPHWH